MRLKILLLIAIVISVQAVAGSSSIDVRTNPVNMSFKLAPTTSAEQSLYVMNTGSEIETYRIFVEDNNYADWFTFSSTSFDLKAGDTKEVKVTLNVPATAETNAECKIKIPYNVSEKSTGTEVIIPVHIEISTSEMSYSEKSSSDGSFSGESRSSLESYNSAKVKEISQQLVVNASNLVVDSKKDITYTGEKLKASADNLEDTANQSIDNLEDTTNERIDNWKDTANRSIDNWENTANQSIDNATVSLDKVTRKFEATGRKIEDKTKKYKDPNRIYEDTIQYIDKTIKVCLAKILTYLSNELATLQTDVCYDSIILM